MGAGEPLWNAPATHVVQLLVKPPPTCPGMRNSNYMELYVWRVHQLSAVGCVSNRAISHWPGSRLVQRPLQ